MRFYGISARFFAEPAARKQAVAVNAGHRGFIEIGQAKMAGGRQAGFEGEFRLGHRHARTGRHSAEPMA